MIRYYFLTWIFAAAFLLQSCFKKDEMISPHPRGDVRTDTVAMTGSYLYQVYFSLDSGKVIGENVKTVSDLGFECGQDGWHVILNTSDFMKAADLGKVQFGAAHDTLGRKLKFDKSDGNPDSTAIGTWFEISGNDTVSNKHVYAISRGLDEKGNPLGLYQIIFDSLKQGTYFFRYALLGGGNQYQGRVGKDPSVNYLFFSLKAGTICHLEPPASDYELVFTQYTTLLFTDAGAAYPYLVTGLLINRKGVEVATDSVHLFSALDRSLALTLDYSKALDVIGYDWKFYDFDSGAYTIRPNLSFIIRNSRGLLIKLRFIGFYNKNGEKGYPAIEYQVL